MLVYASRIPPRPLQAWRLGGLEGWRLGGFGGVEAWRLGGLGCVGIPLLFFQLRILWGSAKCELLVFVSAEDASENYDVWIFYRPRMETSLLCFSRVCIDEVRSVKVVSAKYELMKCEVPTAFVLVRQTMWCRLESSWLGGLEPSFQLY